VQGTLGVIAAAATAISSVIGNFQMAGMNKSLDLIEHETRYAQIHLLHILEKLNDFLPKLADIHSYLWTAQFPTLRNIEDALNSLGDNILRVVTGNSFATPALAIAGVPQTAQVEAGDRFTINIDGLRVSPGADDALDLFREGARQLRARGVRHSTGLR
jgi:hypothetical protein